MGTISGSREKGRGLALSGSRRIQTTTTNPGNQHHRLQRPTTSYDRQLMTDLDRMDQRLSEHRRCALARRGGEMEARCYCCVPWVLSSPWLRSPPQKINKRAHPVCEETKNRVTNRIMAATQHQDIPAVCVEWNRYSGRVRVLC